MASDNSLPDVNKGNATPPYSDFNDYGDYKDFSNLQSKDHKDNGFAYSLSGDNKDFDIPLLGDQSRNHMDSGFVNPLSSDSGFAIPLIGDQEAFSNLSSGDDKNSFKVNTLSNLGDESENCSKYSRKPSEDLPQFRSGGDKFSAEGFIYEAGGAYQYTKRPSSSRNNGDRSQCDGSRPQGDGTRPQGDGRRPQGDGSRPQGDGSRPQGDGTRPQGDGCRPQGDGSRPQGDGSRPQGDGIRPQGDGIRPDGDGFFRDGYTRFPPVAGSATVKDSHNSTRFSGNAFPKSLENILKKIDNITDPQTSMGGSKCVEDEKSQRDRFRNENRKDNQLKSRRPINHKRGFESEEPYARNLRGRERQSGGMRIKDTRKYQGMSYLKCQITSADGKICRTKGFRFWYEVLPHMYYSHMERLYQLAVNTSTIVLYCPYNDPNLGISCESKLATSQPYDCDKPFNEQLAQALFSLTSHIEELHNGRSSSGQCPVCKDDLLVRPYIGREMAMFWIHLATHLPDFLALPPGSIPGKPIKLSVLGDLHCVCDYHFVSGHDYVSHIVNHHTADIQAAAARDGWVKLNCPAAQTCRFETRRVMDVEREVELGLAYSQLFDHIREWHASGRNVIAPVHHCPTCLVSTTEMPDHVMWRHVARHEDLASYFCVPCGVFVLRREMENHLQNCRALKETRVGGKGDVRERKGDVKERKGDVKERLLQLSGSIQLPAKPTAGEMEIRMPRREMGNRHWLPAGEMGHRPPPGEMGQMIPPGEMGHRMPPGEMGHRMPPGEMGHRMPPGEMKNRMLAGEMEHRMHPREMRNRHPIGEIVHRLPVREMEYGHGLLAGEMEYGHRLPVREMDYAQVEQRMATGEIQHRLPLGEMKTTMQLSEMREKMPGDVEVRKRILKINNSNIWDEGTRHSSRWEMAYPEGKQRPHIGRYTQIYFGPEGANCSVQCNLESKNPLEMHQNRPEENFSFNESLKESSMVKAQFELQYTSSTSSKDFNIQSSVEKDLNQNVKLPFIEGPEIGWGDFSNLEKPEPLERFQNAENKWSQLVEKTIGDKNLFNAFTKKEDEVTTSEKIIQVKSDDLHETYIIPKISKLDDQNDVNEASPVQVIEHKKIKVTLLNREKANDLDKNPCGSDPTISSTFTQDTGGDTIPAISSTFTQDTCGDTTPIISSASTQNTCGENTLIISSASTQDTCGETTQIISSASTQDTCGDTKSSQETCNEGTEVLNKQSVKQFSCDVCGTKFMKEHILNFHKAIHK